MNFLRKLFGKEDVESKGKHGQISRRVTSDDAPRASQMNAQELVNLYKTGERDFSGADLSSDLVSLPFACLREANLHEANLSFADLNEADLTKVDLSGADLRQAQINSASLIQANLYGANLEGAWLVRTMLDDANLGGASLDGADLEGATLPDGTKWASDTDMARFTDHEHPDFWRSDNPDSPAYRGG
jgi:uncharacterized protein YjbI with pentapeptide repeats